MKALNGCFFQRTNGSALLAWAILMGCALEAGAHPNLQDAMWVQFEPQLVHVAVNVSVQEIFVAQGRPIDASSSPDLAPLNRAARNHGDYLLKHLKISAGGDALIGKIVQLTPPPVLADPAQTFYQYELECSLNGPVPAEVAFFHDMLEEWPYAAGTAWEVSYVVRAKRSDSNEVTTWLLRDRQPATISTGWKPPGAMAAKTMQPDGWRTFHEYLWHGVLHILTGCDHLLFVGALVIATLSIWEMVKVIAAFTLAHTLTLTLSVFDIFRLPSSVVEPVIALSIVYVALENVLAPKRAHSRIRLAVAFFFGLIHGLGFAGGLLTSMEGLPSVDIWIALAAFSLGVEIGHQVLVLPLFGLLTLGQRQSPARYRPLVLRYGSALISCCGSYYLVAALQAAVFPR